MEEIDRDREATAHRRLNVGCGRYPLRYYTNLDADVTARADVHCRVPPLPYADESLDEVWACHFLEHLPPEEGFAFLRECYRCLVPGGQLGVVVPDTREIARRYLAGAIDHIEYPEGVYWPVASLDTLCSLFFYSTAQDSPHRWCYDAQTLAQRLRRAGFERLREIDRYTDPRLGSGQWYQCGWQAYKPGGAA